MCFALPTDSPRGRGRRGRRSRPKPSAAVRCQTSLPRICRARFSASGGRRPLHWDIAPGILLAARLLVSRAGAPQGPVSPTYQQAGANQMKRVNHRSFLLLLFLAATASVEFRYGAVVAFRFADVSVRQPLGNKAMPADSERPRQLRERAHYGLICGPQRLSTILRSGNDVQPGLERFRHLKRGTTVPIPER